jgi:hypothetical protein
MHGDGLHCPDYSRDVSIRDRSPIRERVSLKKVRSRRRKVKKLPKGLDII